MLQRLFLILKPYLPKVAQYIGKGKNLANKDKLDFSQIKTQITEEVFSDQELVKNPDLIKEYKNILIENDIVPNQNSAKSLIRYALPNLSTTAKKNYDEAAYSAIHKPKTEKEKKISSLRMKKMDRTKQVLTNLNKAKQQYEDVRNIILNAKKEGKNIHLGEAYDILTPNMKAGTKSGRIGEKFDKNAKKMIELWGDDPEVIDLLNFIKKQREKYKVATSTSKSLPGTIHTSKIRKWKHMRDKFQHYFDDPLEAEHTMMRPDKYDLVDIGQTEVAVRFREPDYLTTRPRNLEKNEIVKDIKMNMFDKKELIDALEFSLNETGRPNPNILTQIADIEAKIQASGKRAEDLGLQIALTDKPTGKIKYFGKPYTSLVQLKKSLETEPFKDGGFASLEEVLRY
jgi:hypothetical protein